MMTGWLGVMFPLLQQAAIGSLSLRFVKKGAGTWLDHETSATATADQLPDPLVPWARTWT